jgi:integrase
MKAWVYQDDHQVKKHGANKASWYVGWVDPEGKRRCKSCGSGSAGKSAAEKLRQKIQAELITGTYQSNSKKTWADFRQEYETKIVAGLAPRSRPEVMTSLNAFERIIKPVRMATIKTATIDEFRAKRRQEAGKKKGDLISPATVNKDLRHLRAALRRAHRWGYLQAVVYVDLEKEARKLPTFITPEHFAAIYAACEKAKLPDDLTFSAADWWRALLVMAYMTGWRISDLLALRRDDLDMKAGTAITRAEDNKGNRDDRAAIHPLVIEHLHRIACFTSLVFAWNRDRRTLQTEFARIQEAAGIHLPCLGKHEHTRFCYVYGFHDLRRAFATMNADKLTLDALQALMRHKSYQTTQRYINTSRQLDQAVKVLHVPELPKLDVG